MSKAHWTSFKQHCRSVVMPDITFHDNSRQNSEHLTHATINSADLSITPKKAPKNTSLNFLPTGINTANTRSMIVIRLEI